MANNVERLYGELWGQEDPELSAKVEASLYPRTPALLYDLFAQLGVRSDNTVLDIGCRDARHSVALAQKFSCRAIALDLIPRHWDLARQQISAAKLDDRIAILGGRIEALPLADNSVDLLWCRDVLTHVSLPQGLAECNRVLRPGGRMLVYQTFATEMCEPQERAFLCEALALVPQNMDETYFEQTAAQCGFEVLLKDRIDSEWREGSLERGEPEIADSLLHISRMRRRRQEWIAQHGKDRFEALYASDLWGIYQLLGKLCPTVHLLKSA